MLTAYIVFTVVVMILTYLTIYKTESDRDGLEDSLGFRIGFTLIVGGLFAVPLTVYVVLFVIERLVNRDKL